MSEKEFSLSYWYDGPLFFSSTVAQAFLHFGFHHEKEEKALWHFRVGETTEGYEAALFREGILYGKAAQYANRREMTRFLMDSLAELSGKPLGRWGYLLGMRPGKALYPFLSEGEDWEEKAEQFLRDAKVEEVTGALLMSVLRCQKKLLEKNAGSAERKAALYVHIPFCPSHCIYCSFPSAVVKRGKQLDRFTELLCEDIRRAGQLIRRKKFSIESLYFGGGTPTILTEGQMKQVLETVRDSVPIDPETEWTVEAGRPDTVTPAMLSILRGAGVSRISINPQTMQQKILDRISRTHRASDIFRAFHEARAAGFSVINMDFICGLPGQRLPDMEENLQVICQLRPENVTIHTLAVKRGSPFFQREKEYFLPPEAEVEEMLQRTHRRLLQKGYHPYYLYRQKYMTDDFANIGYALDGCDSAYNMQMIGEHQHVIGAGAGAVSKAVLPGGFHLKKLYLPRNEERYENELQMLCDERDRLWDFLPE